MRKYFSFLTVFAALVITISNSCSKGGGDKPCTETGLSFTTSPALNSNQPAAPGPDFPLVVTLNNPIPPGGVKIDITVKQQNPANSPAFFTVSRTTNSAVNNFSITGTPSGAVSIVEIVATSVTCATNKFSGTYTYSRK